MFVFSLSDLDELSLANLHLFLIWLKLPVFCLSLVWPIHQRFRHEISVRRHHKRRQLPTSHDQADRRFRRRFFHQLALGFHNDLLMQALSGLMALLLHLTLAPFQDPDTIITALKDRCNAGSNCHVWRQQFSSRVQREKEAISDWQCDLRSISSKCKFGADCCAACRTLCSAPGFLGNSYLACTATTKRGLL